MTKFELERFEDGFVIAMVNEKGERVPYFVPFCPKCNKPALFQMCGSNEVFCFNCGAVFKPKYEEVKFESRSQP